MTAKLQRSALILFNLAYLLPFTLYYLAIQNHEFLFYIFILVALILAVALAHRKIGLSAPLLWALSVWGLMHMAGGGLIINGTKLYDQQLIPIWVTDNFYILAYDQFVHLYLYFVMVFLLFYLSRPAFQTRQNPYSLYFLITLASIGIGALNEVAEFIAVLAFDDTGVGGYYNTAWDIVFNTLGSIAGIISLHLLNSRSTK